MDYFFLLAILQIVWIDVLLSGDNAVVIALACQSLPPKKRVVGLTLGVVLAVVTRIVMAAFVSEMLTAPFLKIVGGALLVYIAVKVIVGENEEDAKQRHASSLWMAIGLIVMADITMSLDNVVAIAAAARGNNYVFMFGLALSMPLMIVGASLISKLVERFPLMVWAGGGLLGWIAGGMAAADAWVPRSLGDWHYVASLIGAGLVILTAHGVNHMRRSAAIRAGETNALRQYELR